MPAKKTRPTRENVTPIKPVRTDAANESRPRNGPQDGFAPADYAGQPELERAGWEQVREAAQEQRMELVAGLVDSAATQLPEELQPLFVRSIEPSPPGM